MTLAREQRSQGVIPAKAGIHPSHGSRLSPGRHRIEAAREHKSADSTPTYYDQPALKPSFWGWKVSVYIFIGGLAGASQVIATLAELADRRRYRELVRNGRLLALAGAAAGAPLLIADLHTPQRFYNMLRIFRPTSPMSIGTYVLTGFGALSVVLAARELRHGPDRPAPIVLQVSAAATGALMSTYTGALLCATSTPLWAAAPRIIPALFGASAIASAAAALALTVEGNSAPALGRIEAAASAVELFLLYALRRRLVAKGVRTRLGVAPLALAAAAPLIHQAAAAIEGISGERPAPAAAARRAEGFGKAASIAVLAGALLLRHFMLSAGNRSAERPRDYFRFAAIR